MVQEAEDRGPLYSIDPDPVSGKTMRLAPSPLCPLKQAAKRNRLLLYQPT